MNTVNPLVFSSRDISIRENAVLNLANGTSLHNAAVMWYGRAKSGKTRTLIQAFSGEKFLFLDFDRNYRSTIESIQNSGATYLNGDAAFDVLTQLASGRGSDQIVIVDALGSVVTRLVSWFIDHNTVNDNMSVAAKQIIELKKNIGVSHEATVTFFNLIIEPMTRNGNSINFIHHTTENSQGSKMEGNKGSWLSVFDFTYVLNVDRKVFELEAGRLPIAPNVIGSNNPRQMLIQAIKDSIESLRVLPQLQLMEVALWNKIYKSKQSIRPLMNQLKENGTIIFATVESSKAVFIDVQSTLEKLEPANIIADSTEEVEE